MRRRLSGLSLTRDQCQRFETDVFWQRDWPGSSREHQRACWPSLAGTWRLLCATACLFSPLAIGQLTRQRAVAPRFLLSIVRSGGQAANLLALEKLTVQRRLCCSRLPAIHSATISFCRTQTTSGRTANSLIGRSIHLELRRIESGAPEGRPNSARHKWP